MIAMSLSQRSHPFKSFWPYQFRSSRVFREDESNKDPNHYDGVYESPHVVSFLVGSGWLLSSLVGWME